MFNGRTHGILGRVLAAAFVVATVVAWDPGGLSPFGPAKWAVASVGALALGAAALRRPWNLDRRTSAVIGLLLGWFALAAAVSVDGVYAWVGTPERHWGFVSWMLVALALVSGATLRNSERDRLADGAAAAALLVGLWSIAELAGWRPVELLGAGSRPAGPYGSSAYLGAGAACLCAAAVGVAADESRSRMSRIGAGVGATSSLVAVVASGARAAWVGLLGAALVTLVLRRPPLRPTSAVVALAVVLVVATAAFTGVTGRLTGATGDGSGGGVRGRLDEWRVAMRMVLDRPLTGFGPEGHRIAFAGAVDDSYERNHGRDPLPDRAHSVLLDAAVTGGVPGSLALLALMALAARRCASALRRAPPAVAGLAAAVLAHFVQSLFLFPVPELDLPVWLLAGAVIGWVAPVRAGLAPPRVLAAATAALACIALVAGILDLVADRAARRALDHPGTGDTGIAVAARRLRPDALRYRLVEARWHEARGDGKALDAAVAALRDARDLSPLDPVLDREMGRLLLERARRSGRAGDLGEARALLEEAARRDPRNAQTLLRVGLVRELSGDLRGAERAWKRAEWLAPSSGAASANLALSYLRQGRLGDARAAARRALTRDPDSVEAAEVLRRADGT